MRPADALTLGQIWQIPRLQRLSRMQEHSAAGKARGYRRQMSGVQGRQLERAEITLGEILLRL